MLSTLTEQLRRRDDLTEAQILDAISQLTAESVSSEAKAEFLSALAQKGENTGEIAAFARNLRELSIQPPLDAETRSREILDVCGTGGDKLNTFNISTTVAIVCASGGVTVAKHGNRAITSQSGSADVLETLGIRIDLTPEEAARSLKEHHFAFFFAQKYHPAFKHIGPARKLCAERGQRTIFNFLGPLMNPVRPSTQLIGVSRSQLCEPMARVLQSLGIRRGMVVTGIVPVPGQATPAHLDEFSTLGETHIAEFYQDRGFTSSVFKPEHHPLQPATLADLAGGDKEANAAIVRRLLAGDERGPKRDAVLLNAGAAFFVAGKVKSIAEGWDLAAHLIDSGRTSAQLKALTGQ